MELRTEALTTISTTHEFPPSRCGCSFTRWLLLLSRMSHLILLRLADWAVARPFGHGSVSALSAALDRHVDTRPRPVRWPMCWFYSSDSH